MKLGEIVKRISRREIRIVAALTVGTIVLSSVPAIFGTVLGWSLNMEWRGLLQLSPGDFALYMSNISQAKAGHFLFDNLFAVEATVPSLNLFWWAVGRFAFVFGLTPIIAFHLVRIFLIPVLASVLYIALAYFFSSIRERLTAFVLLMYGSGLGLYLGPFFENRPPTASSYEWPIDLWVGEFNIFTSQMYSPHFVAAWILIVGSALLLLLSFRTGRLLYAVAAGTAALFLFQFHPFHAPTLYATGFVFLCLMALARKFRWRDWLNFAVFVAISVGSFAYHIYYFWTDDFSRQLLVSNTMLTPPILFVLVGIGVVALLAPIGFWLSRRSLLLTDRLFLLAWILSSALLIYSPISFQRRMLQGLEFPLVIFAVLALVAIFDWLKRSRFIGRSDFQPGALILFMLFFLPSNLGIILGSCMLYESGRTSMFYILPNERQALDWIRENTPEDAAFMSTHESGNSIVGWAVRRVYLGHWGNSGDVSSKNIIVRKFFSEDDDAARVKFMRERDIDYVYVGPPERMLGTIKEGEKFERVFATDEIEIFKLR